MATVSELSDPYANFMINPSPPTEVDVCRRCLTYVDGYLTCYPCGFSMDFADAILPISYSIHFGQLHNNLAQYKRGGGRPARRLRLELAAVIWRFLDSHENCLARAAGTDGFDLVTTVPSGSVDRDEAHPLRRIVGNIVVPTAQRHERLLRRSDLAVADRIVDPGKFYTERALNGEDVLLIDDTWTTGASVESAAGALKAAGAGCVGVLVIGRHIHEEYENNATRLAHRPTPFDWTFCALH
jgi:hypothetical protein